MKIHSLIVSILLVACAHEGRLPLEPEIKSADDLRQVADRPSPIPAFLPPIDESWIAYKATSINPPALAWIEPNPSGHKFIDENPFWQTFTVRTASNIDSVFVLVNPPVQGYVEALEVAGGREPPFRNYCPANFNDSPSRARRNGWNLHLSACKQGKTLVVLYGWVGGQLALYNIYPITVQ